MVGLGAALAVEYVVLTKNPLPPSSQEPAPLSAWSPFVSPLVGGGATAGIAGVF